MRRYATAPSARNGPSTASRLIIDKIATVSRDKLGSRIGRLDDADLVRLNLAAAVFLGLA